MSSIVSGALNPLGGRAEEHANRAYDGFRKQTTDIYYISKNTEFTYEQISLIKGHIFYNRHILYSDRRKVDRFDPSYEMAESWRRLSSKNGKDIKQHDILMLHHELLEIQYISRGYSQQEAHDLASMQYDYSKASSNYYRSLGFKI